jgi:hypothetical protein
MKQADRHRRAVLGPKLSLGKTNNLEKISIFDKRPHEPGASH